MNIQKNTLHKRLFGIIKLLLPSPNSQKCKIMTGIRLPSGTALSTSFCTGIHCETAGNLSASYLPAIRALYPFVIAVMITTSVSSQRVSHVASSFRTLRSHANFSSEVRRRVMLHKANCLTCLTHRIKAQDKSPNQMFSVAVTQSHSLSYKPLGCGGRRAAAKPRNSLTSLTTLITATRKHICQIHKG
jgi:hypothetical protein